jgi:hypothetical protein
MQWQEHWGQQQQQMTVCLIRRARTCMSRLAWSAGAPSSVNCAELAMMRAPKSAPPGSSSCATARAYGLNRTRRKARKHTLRSSAGMAV